MSRINVDLNRVNAAADNLFDIALDLEIQIRHIRRSKDSISLSWESVSSGGLQEMMEEIASRMDKCVSEFKSIARDLKTSARQAEQAEREAAGGGGGGSR